MWRGNEAGRGASQECGRNLLEGLESLTGLCGELVMFALEEVVEGEVTTVALIRILLSRCLRDEG